jgi:Flagellar biogenesis protein
MMEGIGDYLKAIFLIVLIIIAAYYVTKYIAARASGPRGRSADIHIRASAQLGRDRSLVVAEVGGMAYILGVTGQHVELIDKVDPEQLDASLPPQQPGDPRKSDFAKEFWERFKGTYHDPGK